jgi:hypothetical protein
MLKEKLDSLVGREEDYPGQTNEIRRNFIVQYAVDAAQALIDEGSNGTVEETDFLISAVTSKFVERCHLTVQSRLLRAELMKE